ncbi:MAG TPA: ribosome biogenesis GTP-binding protein YihA/YsxC [Spirochaetota bacterium]|nr:ribosome biogenesis GTP-binding protein YihA/YsxC [Spirochaetota bacterium]
MMKILKAEYIKSATDPKDYPKIRLPHFAFIGRSNCGKSSLINMLVNRKDLVRVGNKPGMTQKINFFNINDEMVMVDLPGYGFAKVPLKLKEEFAVMIEKFITESENLKAIFLLIDSRRKPGEEERRIITKLSELNIPTAIIATKSDKLKKPEQKKSLETIAGVLEIDKKDIFLSSSTNKNGRREILQTIKELTSA